jgi:hypothetical protein
MLVLAVPPTLPPPTEGLQQQTSFMGSEQNPLQERIIFVEKIYISGWGAD